MEGGGEERSTHIQTYSLATDDISSLWLCGKAKIWKQPPVSCPGNANAPR